MKSPYGSRGAMCAHYGWSWDYLHWGIRWTLVQRILIDAPAYELPKKEGTGPKTHKSLKEGNATEIMNYINSLNE